ncbi:MAG: amino acid ABC transporter permease [Paracoccaceae bacterium]|jgi:polar amino acid transport system permease protein|nr:ABC transporter permease [Marinovum sp.]MBT3650156.1 amino acid ABC transporter permease [Paracoccaceae bacterium]MBT4231140.1 amino acid ABC transporter permease [Paracoccaceae bacterium]MBT5315907.1 amino acid ABC transporter permease [Paracoccaceae bacterium]MBT5475210.1 amino acid ABC transporter permease [Paracoccaceae bacterium]|tara:strand:+ start:3342 stop:4175 length:834 start_codon:yes stop_codon:yes gene_type:complete
MRKRQAASATRREIYEAERRRRSLAVAAASTAVVVLALIVLVPLAPGWEKVQKSFFNGAVLAKSFPRLLDAFKVNVMIFAWSAPSIAILGLLIALARGVRAPTLFPLRIFATIYTDVFRGVPVILTVYLIGFGIPGLGLPRPWNSPYIWGSVALVLTYSAYVAEIFRSGIDSVHHSQRSAALSLGLSEGQAMRDVILPQAVRNVVPSQMNMLIALQKDVSLLSFIGPVEIFRQAGVFKSLLANFTPYVGAAIIFLAVTIPATRYADYLMAKQTRERR